MKTIFFLFSLFFCFYTSAEEKRYPYSKTDVSKTDLVDYISANAPEMFGKTFNVSPNKYSQAFAEIFDTDVEELHTVLPQMVKAGQKVSGQDMLQILTAGFDRDSLPSWFWRKPYPGEKFLLLGGADDYAISLACGNPVAAIEWKEELDVEEELPAREEKQEKEEVEKIVVNNYNYNTSSSSSSDQDQDRRTARYSSGRTPAYYSQPAVRYPVPHHQPRYSPQRSVNVSLVYVRGERRGRYSSRKRYRTGGYYRHTGYKKRSGGYRPPRRSGRTRGGPLRPPNRGSFSGSGSGRSGGPLRPPNTGDGFTGSGGGGPIRPPNR